MENSRPAGVPAPSVPGAPEPAFPSATTTPELLASGVPEPNSSTPPETTFSADPAASAVTAPRSVAPSASAAITLPELLHRREPHPIWQLILGIAGFMVCQILVLVIGAVVAAVTNFSGNHLTLPEQSTGMRADVAWATLIEFAIGVLLYVAVFHLLVKYFGKRPAFELAGPKALQEFGLGLGIGAGLITLPVLILWVLGYYEVVGWGWSNEIIWVLAVSIGAGFMEEILFRGFLLRLLEKWLGTFAALTITALLFGVVHITNPEATWLGAIGIIFEAGILLGGAYLLTRRLWLAIGIHLAWNFFQGAVWSSPISGTGQLKGLVQARFSGPELLTGGSMGLEGSVISIVACTVAGVAMCWLAYQRGHFVGRVNRRQARH